MQLHIRNCKQVLSLVHWLYITWKSWKWAVGTVLDDISWMKREVAGSNEINQRERFSLKGVLRQLRPIHSKHFTLLLYGMEIPQIWVKKISVIPIIQIHGDSPNFGLNVLFIHLLVSALWSECSKYVWFLSVWTVTGIKLGRLYPKCFPLLCLLCGLTVILIIP